MKKFLICFLLISLQSQAADKHDWLTKHPTIQKLLNLTNEQRVKHGIPPLTLNGEMCIHAQNHAGYMVQNGQVHSGLPYRENIFVGPTSAEATILLVLHQQKQQ